MSRSILLFFVALAAAGAVGCDGPCQDLAEQICACEPNETRERACLVNVDISTNESVDAEEDDRCRELQRSCTCDALDRGNYEACGLALSGDPS